MLGETDCNLMYSISFSPLKGHKLICLDADCFECLVNQYWLLQHISVSDRGVLRQVRDIQLSVNALFTTDAVNQAFL